MSQPKTYPLEEALKAQQVLRAAVGLGPEQFPLEAFVGMISDEVETLRNQGHTDDDIAAMIRAGSAIDITAVDITANYASPEQRHQPHHGE